MLLLDEQIKRSIDEFCLVSIRATSISLCRQD